MNIINKYKVTIVLRHKKLFRKELVSTLDILVSAKNTELAENEALSSVTNALRRWDTASVSGFPELIEEGDDSDMKSSQDVDTMIENLAKARVGMREIIEDALSRGKDYALIKEKLSAVKVKKGSVYASYEKKYGPISNVPKYCIVDGINGKLPNGSNVDEYTEAMKSLKESDISGKYKLDFINNYQFVKVNNSFYAIDIIDTYENIAEDTLLVKVSIKEI